MSLAGQVLVVTGGASGIGRAAAEHWMRAGGSAVLADIQDSKGFTVAAAHPGKAVFVHCDTRKRGDLERAAAAAKSLGTLTCWFNNAGGGGANDSVAGLRQAKDINGLRAMVDLNLSAYIEGTSVALQSFTKERGGTVVSTASMAGLLPLGAPPVYSATKAANIQFTRAIGLTLGDKSNVRVYALCPSYAATPGGPAPETIKKSLGGVLTQEHMAEGFMLLVTQRPPNGSVMRVTARKGGAQVVQDLMAYGRELGGAEAPRNGAVMKSAPLAAHDGAHRWQPPGKL